MSLRALATGIIAATATVAVVAIAQPGPPPGYNGGEPVRNVDPHRHGNIARAQALSQQAYDAMSAAQQANEFDMGGHASKAKEYLRLANEEMKQAALAANRR